MAGFKETPRQKMISMMYLVYTALLALNVSVDILDAFVIVNENIEEANESFAVKMDAQYAKFESQYNMNRTKVGEYWTKALDVRSKTDEMVNYIEKMKLDLVMLTDKKTYEEIFDTITDKPLISNHEKADSTNRRVSYEFNLRNVGAKDNYDDPTRFLINDRNAYELETKLAEYRKFVVETVDGKTVYDVTPTGDTIVVPGNFSKKAALKTNYDEYGKKIKYQDANGTPMDWENKNFYHVILAADITILNKIVMEVQNVEYDAISQLYGSINENDFKFDHIEAKIIPTSTYILTGGKYEANVIVAAYDSKTQLKGRVLQGVKAITKDNKDKAIVHDGQDGVLKIEFPCTRVGEQVYAGEIEMVDPATKQLTTYPFTGEFTVAPPSVTVAPTKMNVFYQGVQNPIKVSSPGVKSSDLVVSISHGKLISKGNGEYMVEVPLGRDVKTTTISAVAKINGRSVNLGSSEFRIKRAPSPIAKIAGMTSGKMNKNTLNGAGAIIPTLEDFDFEGFYYTIQSYEVSTIRGGDLQTTGTIRGGKFDNKVKQMIQGASRGQKIYFEKIQAKGPDGVTRTLNPVNLEIQ